MYKRRQMSNHGKQTEIFVCVCYLLQSNETEYPTCIIIFCLNRANQQKVKGQELFWSQ